MIETLYIPTMGRTDTQVTYDNLPQKYRDMVCIYACINNFDF